MMLATHYSTATFFTLPSLYFTIFNPLVGVTVILASVSVVIAPCHLTDEADVVSI